MAATEAQQSSERDRMSIMRDTKQTHELVTSPELIARDIYATWDQLLENPDSHLTQYQAINKEGLPVGEVAFVAGGELLPQLFGPKANPELSQKISAALEAGKGNLTIAGIIFTEEQLRLLGAFYAHLQDNKNYKLHCIDERLVGDVAASEQQSHESCGACAVTAAALGLQASELLDMVNTDQTKKLQAVDPKMFHHTSLTILVDLHGRDVLVEEQRSEFRDKNSLPFNISLPVKEIEAFFRASNVEESAKEELLISLIMWNAGLARKIIGGDHNTLQAASEYTQIIIDERSIEEGKVAELAAQIKGKLFSLVPHGSVVLLGDTDVQRK